MCWGGRSVPTPYGGRCPPTLQLPASLISPASQLALQLAHRASGCCAAQDHAGAGVPALGAADRRLSAVLADHRAGDGEHKAEPAGCAAKEEVGPYTPLHTVVDALRSATLCPTYPSASASNLLQADGAAAAAHGLAARARSAGVQPPAGEIGGPLGLPLRAARSKLQCCKRALRAAAAGAAPRPGLPSSQAAQLAAAVAARPSHAAARHAPGCPGRRCLPQLDCSGMESDLPAMLGALASPSVRKLRLNDCPGAEQQGSRARLLCAALAARACHGNLCTVRRHARKAWARRARSGPPQAWLAQAPHASSRCRHGAAACRYLTVRLGALTPPLQAAAPTACCGRWWARCRGCGRWSWTMCHARPHRR